MNSRVVKSLLKGEELLRVTKSVAKGLNDMQPNGTWADIDYKDKAVAIWSPALHLTRVQNFAMAYARPNNIYSHDETLYRAIVKTLQAWNRIDPKCNNWWYNEINCPQLLGQIMLLMHSSKPLPRTLQDSLLIKMNRGNMYKQTGANKLDVALHNLYRALLTRDVTLMDSAVSQCFQPVMLTNATEGLMYDYSYLQHGRQLQIASYGSVFLVGEYRIAAYLQGTRWQMLPGKREVLTKFLNNVFLNAIRYKYLDFNVMGRGFTRKDSANTSAVPGLLADINMLKKNDEDNDYTGYIDAVKRASGKVPPSYKIKTTHTQYWIGDYTQHISPDYLFTVRTNSTRTRRTETGNGENLYGRYMSDGATNIQRSGSEYFNIFPVWEYDKIPGVTCREYLSDRAAVNSWDQPGTTNFTGGVSDGQYGVSTYSLDFDSVKAKKAWFFFGKQVVCLGTGISSDTPEPITTTVNQCWSRGRVVVNKAQHSYWQDSIAYYVQPNNHILYSNKEQKGTWEHINNSQSSDSVKGKVFKLWIDHGKQPQNALYSYIVVPGISQKQFLRESPYQELNILSNTNVMQAVRSSQKDVLQVIFYKPGTLHTGKIAVSVSEPCVLMLEKANTTNPMIYVVDPSHQLKTISILLNGKKLNCVLPINEYAGSTLKVIYR
ncbi:polysaccharide lyase family 8 super-sandwich domain-containing protein [Mucilaginibacter gracilis]|uniref:polysaccharide lyase family 8 super-sandwich domain-containing protein n=1 Tax=Mucilaginibacter gracilis TaxID=423350 RepID=UPI0013C2FA96|nr:polysaccharide lyase family 8 super-sandwich domain-containing protein [Mucilaginibacter gracilis]